MMSHQSGYLLIWCKNLYFSLSCRLFYGSVIRSGLQLEHWELGWPKLQLCGHFIAPEAFFGSIWWAGSENAKKFQFDWCLGGPLATMSPQYWTPILAVHKTSFWPNWAPLMSMLGLLVIIKPISTCEMTILAKKKITKIGHLGPRIWHFSDRA